MVDTEIGNEMVTVDNQIVSKKVAVDEILNEAAVDEILNEKAPVDEIVKEKVAVDS